MTRKDLLMTITVPNPTAEAEEAKRHNPILNVHLHVRLSELQPPGVAIGSHAYDHGRVTLTFGDSSGDADVVLNGSAYELRRLSAMLDQAAMEIEAQWADSQAVKAVAV